MSRVVRSLHGTTCRPDRRAKRSHASVPCCDGRSLGASLGAAPPRSYRLHARLVAERTRPCGLREHGERRVAGALLGCDLGRADARSRTTPSAWWRAPSRPTAPTSSGGRTRPATSPGVGMRCRSRAALPGRSWTGSRRGGTKGSRKRPAWWQRPSAIVTASRCTWRLTADRRSSCSAAPIGCASPDRTTPATTAAGSRPTARSCACSTARAATCCTPRSA